MATTSILSKYGVPKPVDGIAGTTEQEDRLNNKPNLTKEQVLAARPTTTGHEPQRMQAPGLVSEDAFQAANTPGRGSTVGDFVPGKSGGWVPRDHPDAIGNGGGPGSTAPPSTGGTGGGGGGGGPAGPAMAGLNAAASGGGYSGGGGGGVAELAPPGASNPNLGQRIYPMAMRQLSLLPRIY